MPCLCTTNTLRFFIRIVAQVDLPSSTIRTSFKPWQHTSIRGLTRTRAVRVVHSNASGSTLASKQDKLLDRSLLEEQDPKAVSKSWPQASAEGIQLVSDPKTGAESTPVKEAKKLSKVARRRKERYESPGVGSNTASQSTVKEVKDPSKVRLRKKERLETLAAEVKPIIRKTETGKTKSTAKPSYAAKENDEWKPPPREHWQLDKAALKAKFPEGWKPLKKLSPDALAGIRALHAQSPEQYTTEVLANSFKMSAEAIRRILKSKWRPAADEETDRQRRWLQRGKIIYTRHADLGQKPPKKWREMGIGNGKPEWMLRKRRDKAPLPTLITTSRAKDAKYGLNGADAKAEKLEDRIL